MVRPSLMTAEPRNNHWSDVIRKRLRSLAAFFDFGAVGLPFGEIPVIDSLVFEVRHSRFAFLFAKF